MLLPRFLTAIFGIPLMLTLIHLGGLPFLVLTVGAAVLALHEYALILWLGGRGVQKIITVIGGGLVALSVALAPVPVKGHGAPGAGITQMAVTALIVAVMLREMFRKDHSLDRAALSLFGAFFIGWSLGHLPLIRQLSPHGEALTYLLFAAVWATDTAAYAAGKLFGRRRLAPVLSPKKSWEGAAAGLAACLATVCLARGLFLAEALSRAATLGLGLLIGLIGQVSDVAQSLVKRACGVKDSGALLPGHGGVFDRADAFLLLAPLFYYAVVLAGI